MKVLRSGRRISVLHISVFLIFSAYSADLAPQSKPRPALDFTAPIAIGAGRANPGAPFLRFAPDGRLFAIWTEDRTGGKTRNAAAHQATGKMAPSPLRDVLLAASPDGGKTWSQAKHINSVAEAIQSEENEPKVAFTADNRAYAVWSIPEEKRR